MIIVTVPLLPSTVTTSPVFNTDVAFRQPTTAGMPNSLATMAACDRGAPMSVTIADTLWNATVQPMLVARVTRLSPSFIPQIPLMSSTTMTVPVTIPAAPAKPLTSEESSPSDSRPLT